MGTTQEPDRHHTGDTRLTPARVFIHKSLRSMKIAPFANEADKVAWQKQKELELAGETGERWRVDVAQGRYGCFARAMRLCQNPNCNRPQVKGNKYCSKCRSSPRADGPGPATHSG